MRGNQYRGEEVTRIGLVHLSILAACLALPLPGSAQTLRGELLGAGSDTPVSGGVVMLLGGEGETIRTVMADSIGLFTLVAPGPGRYSVYAEALGYLSFVDGPLEFAAGQGYQAQIRLELNPIQIDPLEVSAQPLNTWLEMAGFYERKELNRGHFIERAEIEEKKPHSMTDLFRGGTSFRVIPTQVAGSTGGYTVV